MKKKVSKILTMPKDELQQLIYESKSIKDVIIKLGLRPETGGQYKLFKKRNLKDNFDLSKLDNVYQIKTSNLIELSEVLVEDIIVSSTWIKKRLIKENMIENKCSECGMIDNWNNKPINLQLDHINGDSRDNRFENLRILCPNCHSQTDTYCRRTPIKKCLACGIKITNRSKTGKCFKCYNNSSGYIPIKSELENDVNNMLSKHQLSKKYNVSLTTIDNWSKKFGLIFKNKTKSELSRPSKEQLHSDIKEMKQWNKICKKYNVSENTIKRWAVSYNLV